MIAPAGSIVSLYVDLVAPVELDDIIRTQTGRRYLVIAVRVQELGKHRGRQHLRVVVLAPDDSVSCPDATIHDIRWYAR